MVEEKKIDVRGVFLKVYNCYCCPMRLMDKSRKRFLNLCTLTQQNIKFFKDSIPEFCELKKYEDEAKEEVKD